METLSKMYFVTHQVFFYFFFNKNLLFSIIFVKILYFLIKIVIFHRNISRFSQRRQEISLYSLALFFIRIRLKLLLLQLNIH